MPPTPSTPVLQHRSASRWRPLPVLGALLAALIVVLTGASQAAAQDYFIPGNIKHDGEPLADVRVILSGPGVEEEATTDERGQFRFTVTDKEAAYEVEVDESTLPEGIVVEGDNPRGTEFGAQSFRPVNFFLGEGVRETSSFGAQLVERLVNGVNFGLMLALAAIGVSLVFGTTGLSNFAHAEMVTFGAVAALTFSVFLDLSMWLAIPLAVVISAGFGWFLDFTVWKPLRVRRVAIVQVMIVSIGLSLLLRYIFQFYIGGGTSQLPGIGMPRKQYFGFISLNYIELASMAVSIVVLLATAWWLMRTKTGKATRAISDNRALAAATGIDVDRVVRIVWIGAGALAGLSGVLWAYFRPGIKWDMGVQVLLLMFAGVVLGGLGTAFGALVGSMIVGILVEVSTLWIPSDMKYVGALLVLIVVLLFRPQGLLGRRERIG